MGQLLGLHLIPPLWLYGAFLFKRTLGSSASLGLAGGSAHPPLGVPASSLTARFSMVYICFPRYGTPAPRDMVLNTVPTPGAPYKELGGRGGTGNGNPAQAGVEAGTG